MTWGREMGRKVFSPSAELLGRHAGTVIGRFSEDTENTGGKETCDGHCHTGEALHEEVGLVLAIKLKG